MKFYIFANDIVRLNRDVPFEFNKRTFLLKKSYPVDRDEIYPVEGDTVETPNHNSRCINVGAHGAVLIRLHRRAGIIGKGKIPERISVPATALGKLPGESTGDSLFVSARIHGN